MAELLLEGVTKIYPQGRRAVDDLTLDVRDGEFMVLVGPSGCGKSTTLRIIAGLERPDRGGVCIDGQRVDGQPPRDRDVAMVFQDAALYPHLTVGGNLAFSLKRRGVGRRERDARVAEVARLMGIEDLLARRPSSLSGGERQRVALGRAIVRRPRVFLLDEPLSHLDPALRRKMRLDIRVLHEAVGATTVYVTHDCQEAVTLGDRIAVMDRGALQQCGPPREVYHRPVNRFVAGFIGTPPMNFLEGRLSAMAGGLEVELGSQRLRLPERMAILADRAGEAVALGIRPESLTAVAGGDGDEKGVLRAVVRGTEFLGDGMDVHLMTQDGQDVVCRWHGSRPLDSGEVLEMHVNMDQVHVFELGDEGVNLSLTGTGDHTSVA